MKKILSIMAFFIILPFSFSVVSCTYNQKNTADNLINWFDINYDSKKVLSIDLNYHVNNLYQYYGYDIDKVVYENNNIDYDKNLINEKNVYYIIYSEQNHKFYSTDKLEDNIYGFISWTYVLNNDLTKTLYDCCPVDEITSVFVLSVNEKDAPYKDFILNICYLNKDDNNYMKTFYGKWVFDVSVPTFKLTS